MRYWIDAPRSYVKANLVGTFELLEAARVSSPQHMLLASTSSAYGASTEMPYAATKKANEIMALFKFTKAILEGITIDIYNHGDMSRDFTYIDDLVAEIVNLIEAVPEAPNAREAMRDGDSFSVVALWRVVNIGNGQPVQLMKFIEAIEAALGQEAKKHFMDMQPGDVPATGADARLLEQLTGTIPQTSVEEGVSKLVAWCREYYAV